MLLNETIKQELITAISKATEESTSFPIEVTSLGGIKHKIATQETSGHLITTVEVGGADYLIYLI